MSHPVRDGLAAHGLLFPLLGRKRRLPRRLVTRATDVCLEGYPRSANSYTFFAFRRWNPGLRVAHHLHTPLQVTRAVRLGVPCAVLIRPPLDAIASVLVMDRGRISDTAAYRSYIHFYSHALRARDRVVVAPFAEATEDPAGVIARLNSTFKASFAWEPMTSETREELLARVERPIRRPDLPATSSGAPSAEKERRKEELRERLAAHPLLTEAESLHATWVRGRP